MRRRKPVGANTTPPKRGYNRPYTPKPKRADVIPEVHRRPNVEPKPEPAPLPKWIEQTLSIYCFLTGGTFKK